MKQQKGFTLVEAAVAIGVVAILSGIIIPLVLKNLRDARIARARNDIHVIAAAIAHQLKDMGTRPVAAMPAAALGGMPANGLGNAVWYSQGVVPVVVAGPGGAAPVPLPAVNGNTFANLFSFPTNALLASLLFGFPAPPAARDQFGYRGPYLATDQANQTDPWGRAYVILGYNQDGQTTGGPIWVVCAGETHAITQANLQLVAGAGGLQYNRDWDYAGLSNTNIAVRVQ
jgi:prepilin-type N-terminal cleavage/methylation domain-containing protein